MKKQYCIMAALFILAACSITGCKNKGKEDLTGIHSKEETMETTKETMAETTAAVKETEAAETTAAGTSASTALNVRSKIATEKDGKISIEYPILSNLRDETTTETVNSLIRESALKLITANNLNPEKDSVTVICDIISLDRSRAVMVFRGSMMTDGAAYPVSLFYTLTADLSKGTLVGLSDYADPYTMAGYILSEDCIITEASDKDAAGEYLGHLELDTLWQTLKAADFTSAGSESFPESFSYVNNGVIYISVSVPHALGDYILVEFHPEAK